jgi:hypothetical protein
LDKSAIVIYEAVAIAIVKAISVNQTISQAISSKI